MTEPMFGLNASAFFDNDGKQIGRTRYGIYCVNEDCKYFNNERMCSLEKEIIDEYGLSDTIPYERVNKIPQMICDKCDGVTSKW